MASSEEKKADAAKNAAEVTVKAADKSADKAEATASAKSDSPHVLKFNINLGNKLGGTVDWFEKWIRRGKNPLIAFLALWLVNFGPARQLLKALGVDLEYAKQKAGVSLKTPLLALSALIVITIVSTLLVYTKGGGLPIVISGISMFLLTSFIAALLGLYDMLVAKPGRDSKKKGPKDLGVHIMWWVFPIIAINLLSKPWLPGNLEYFGLLLVAELGLFIVNKKTREVVRFGSVSVMGVVGAVAFTLLFWSHWPTGVTQTINSIILTPEERICNVDGDWRLHEKDVKMISYVLADISYRMSYIEIDGKRFIRGDFNRDGKLEVKDSIALADFVCGIGPAPTPLYAAKKKRSNSSYEAVSSGGKTHASTSASSRSGAKGSIFQPNPTPHSVAPHAQSSRNSGPVQVSVDSIKFFMNPTTLDTTAIHAWVRLKAGDKPDTINLQATSEVWDDKFKYYNWISWESEGPSIGRDFVLQPGHQAVGKMAFSVYSLSPGLRSLSLCIDDKSGRRYVIEDHGMRYLHSEI